MLEVSSIVNHMFFFISYVLFQRNSFVSPPMNRYTETSTDVLRGIPRCVIAEYIQPGLEEIATNMHISTEYINNATDLLDLLGNRDTVLFPTAYDALQNTTHTQLKASLCYLLLSTITLSDCNLVQLLRDELRNNTNVVLSKMNLLNSSISSPDEMIDEFVHFEYTLWLVLGLTKDATPLITAKLLQSVTNFFGCNEDIVYDTAAAREFVANVQRPV